MKYIKMLGLAAVAAAALTAFVGASTASATTLTDENGAVGVGRTIHANNEGVVRLTTTFKNIECNTSTVSGEVTNAGGAGVPVSGSINSLTFEGCNCTVNVISKGNLSINGTTVSSNGAEVTASCSTIFGNVHCIYVTEAGTTLGTLTTSSVTGGTATLDIEENNIPRLTTNILCAEKANWDAKYVVDNPDVLNVD
jgi:hypothetical protein